MFHGQTEEDADRAEKLDELLEMCLTSFGSLTKTFQCNGEQRDSSRDDLDLLLLPGLQDASQLIVNLADRTDRRIPGAVLSAAVTLGR